MYKYQYHLDSFVFSLCSWSSLRRYSFFVLFFFFSLSLPKASLTSKDFSFTLQYYMHARHLALSRTFPDKFEMEPCAPPKVKSAFRDEFICVFSYFTERRKGICVCERKRVSKVLLNNREVNSQLKPLFIDPGSNQNL